MLAHILRCNLGELQVTSYKLQATGCKLQATSYKLQAASCKLQAAGYRLPTLNVCEREPVSLRLASMMHVALSWRYTGMNLSGA